MEPQPGRKERSMIAAQHDVYHRTLKTELVKPRLWSAVLLGLSFLTGCGTVWEPPNAAEPLKGFETETRTDPFERSRALIAKGDYESAYQENHKIFTEGKGAADVALFNMGMVSASSLNPRKNYPRALVCFTTLVNDHPQSALIEQTKLWIQVLKEQEKVAHEKQRVLEEKQKIIEDKRTLIRERELMSQEKEQLKYTVEKSRQVDIEIEKLRRQTQKK
jgi:hypothetical protein